MFYFSDPLCFPLEGFDPKPSDHWTITVSNLQKVNNYMEEYLETVLKLPVMKDYVNVQSIIRDNDHVNLLRPVIGF